MTTKMSPAEIELARIINDMERLGHLQPEHAKALHRQLSQLLQDTVNDLVVATSVLNAELQTARIENDELMRQRDATRAYLGDRVAPSDRDPEMGLIGSKPEDILRETVKNIIAAYGADKKIHCIKELRNSRVAIEAWAHMGNTINIGSNPDGSTYRVISLKDAKDITDVAISGKLWTGRGYEKL